MQSKNRLRMSSSLHDNKRKAKGAIFPKSDHTLVNHLWIRAYLYATLTNLTITVSYYDPVVLNSHQM